MVRSCGDYPLLSGGDINLYSLFVERAMGLIKPDGVVGLLTPSGIYADKTAARFFKSVSTRGRVGSLFDFENRRLGTGLPPFFPDVDSRFKFCALIFGGEDRLFDQTECAFFLDDTKTIHHKDRCFPLTPADFAGVNPNTGTAPVFRSRRDADITRRIYERHPVLVERSGGTRHRAWPVKYMTMFHMTNDSDLFHTAPQLETEGFYPVAGNRWKRGEELYLPLYEGKMVQAYDHRAASVVVNPENLNRPAQPREATSEEHANPDWLPDPQFWVRADSFNWPWQLEWVFGFKDITAATNRRTMIASLFPKAAFGNKVPVFLPVEAASTDSVDYKNCAVLLGGNFNSMAFDFIARQKVHGQTLNLYIVEQLPVIASSDYDLPFGATTARDLVHDHVLRLTYTAHDMAPFARDLGYDGPPLYMEQRGASSPAGPPRRAVLPPLRFDPGRSRLRVGHLPDSPPEDEAAFGRYRTRDLILAYMNALAAGDTETQVVM